MKNCDECRYAIWKMTAAGRRHPSGYGTCTFNYRIPELPASMYWVGGSPVPRRLAINRKAELERHCPYWSRADANTRTLAVFSGPEGDA